MPQESPAKFFVVLGLAASLVLVVHFAIWPSLNVSADQTLATVSVSAPAVVPGPKLINGALTLDLTARAYLSAYINQEGQTEILIEKNADAKMPIASLTKLVTAMLASPSDELLYPLLIESNNQAAMMLAEKVGQETFVSQMNQVAATLGLSDTYFVNPSGLDSEATSTISSFNYSTAHDLLRLSTHLLAHRPDLLAISILPQYGAAQNINELLTGQSWSPDIVGGKTGKTNLAKKNLLLILRPPGANGYIINIVLGANDHFTAMRQLTNWVLGSYEF